MRFDNDGPCLCGDPGCGRCFPQPYGTNFKRKTIKLKKGRKKRAEAKRVKSVRPACVARDGYCRPAKDLNLVGECEGRSEWAHLPDYTRAKTRKMSPEQRHSTEWTVMACKKHHDQIDGRRTPQLLVAMPDPEGADGMLRWCWYKPPTLEQIGEVLQAAHDELLDALNAKAQMLIDGLDK